MIKRNNPFSEFAFTIADIEGEAVTLTGLVCTTDACYKVGDNITLTLSISGVRQTCEGIVSWADRSVGGSGGRRRYGIEFHVNGCSNPEPSRGNVVSSRRRHQRAPVEPYVLKNPGLRAVDVSVGGMSFSSSRKYRPGQRLDLEVVLDTELHGVQAEVRWCRPSASILTQGYLSGVMFIKPPISLVLAIQKLLQSKS